MCEWLNSKLLPLQLHSIELHWNTVPMCCVVLYCIVLMTYKKYQDSNIYKKTLWLI